MAAPLQDADIAKISSRERQRIAHDLHDGLGQLLGGIALKLQVLHEDLAEREWPEMSATTELIALVNEAISQTRLLSRSLDPVMPPATTLPAALAKLARDTGRLFPGVTCRLAPGESEFGERPEVAQHLFRVAQEATNNAIRHGKATQITLEISVVAGHLQLVIRDNGKGMAPGTEPSSGIGLRIMKHRVQEIGGTLEMEPNPDGGMLVRCQSRL